MYHEKSWWSLSVGRTCGVQSGGVGGRGRRIWRAGIRDHRGGHPLAGEGCRRQGGEEDCKGLHFCDVGEGNVAVEAGLAGQTDWSGTNALFSTERTSTNTRELGQKATLDFRESSVPRHGHACRGQDEENKTINSW